MRHFEIHPFAITAVRTESGNLKLISWRISDSGQITRVDDINAGAISRLSMSGTTTAVRESHGDLKLIRWRVSGSGNLTRDTDNVVSGFPAGGIREVDFNGRFTAVRLNSGDLKIIKWRFTDDLIERVTDNEISGFPAGAIKIVTVFKPKANRIVSAVRLSNDRLKVILWEDIPFL